MSTPTPDHTPERILHRLDWQVIRRLDGLLQGDYRSLFYGYGLDFADLREYQPEDDVRYIDWNVTARMNTPYVRQYVEDREITAWFLLDLSPSVDFGTLVRQKRAVLIDLVATLARLLTRHGNRVGAILYGSRVERTIPARGGRIQVLRLANDLLKQPPLARAPFTDLTPLLDGRAELDQAALADLHHLRFHQRAGLGAPAELAQPAPRSAGHPPVGSARDRAARCRPDHHGGCRDRRAAVCRHARQEVPPALSSRRAGARGRPERVVQALRRRSRCRSRPRKIWFARSCASPPCGSNDGNDFVICELRADCRQIVKSSS